VTAILALAVSLLLGSGPGFATPGRLAGESYQATLDATFATAEPAILYFDVLVAGSTRNWDVHQARELRLAP
jgi:hypothetical protein